MPPSSWPSRFYRRRQQIFLILLFNLAEDAIFFLISTLTISEGARSRRAVAKRERRGDGSSRVSPAVARSSRRAESADGERARLLIHLSPVSASSPLGNSICLGDLSRATERRASSLDTPLTRTRRVRKLVTFLASQKLARFSNLLRSHVAGSNIARILEDKKFNFPTYL